MSILCALPADGDRDGAAMVGPGACSLGQTRVRLRGRGTRTTRFTLIAGLACGLDFHVISVTVLGRAGVPRARFLQLAMIALGGLSSTYTASGTFPPVTRPWSIADVAEPASWDLCPFLWCVLATSYKLSVSKTRSTVSLLKSTRYTGQLEVEQGLPLFFDTEMSSASFSKPRSLEYAE